MCPKLIFKTFGKMGCFSLASVLLFIFAAAPGCTAQETRSLASEKLSLTVKHLGLEKDNPSWGFDDLALSPVEASKMIAQQLVPIAGGWYSIDKKTRESRHLVASLRALHYLTGRTYSASTKAKLTADQKQFLDFDKEMQDKNPSHQLHFFSVWMSRDAYIIAPRDVQEAIIKKWRAHCNGKDDGYRPTRPAKQCMQSWYWFG